MSGLEADKLSSVVVETLASQVGGVAGVERLNEGPYNCEPNGYFGLCVTFLFLGEEPDESERTMIAQLLALIELQAFLPKDSLHLEELTKARLARSG